MFYCPKCQQNYDEGLQRFCSNDGIRLLPAPSSGKSVNQSNGVFTSILGRTAPGNKNDEKLSAASNYVKTETFNFVQTKTFSPTIENTSVAEQKSDFENKSETAPQKPLPRIIKTDEIPVSQAKLGDRKINLTRENADILLGQTVKGRYKIVKISDKDAASAAYLAEDKIVPEKKVVVRILMDEAEADDFSSKIFAEERVSLSLVDHPNIARILDSGELFEGKPFIISEFAEGESVGEKLEKIGQFNTLRTARIIRQTANALSEAHRNGVLHRNLKPENIILTISSTGNEQVKLINFGVFRDDSDDQNIVYKSPEQIEGKPANFASDIYSLAVIAYQMLTNRLPFNGSSVRNLLSAQREGLSLHPTNLRLDLPASVDRILEKALNFSPTERFPKAHDFGDSFSNSLTTSKILDDNEKFDDIELITEEDVENAIRNSSLSVSEPGSASEEVSTAAIIVSSDSEQNIVTQGEETAVKESVELPWEKRTFDSPKFSKSSFILFSVIGILFLLAASWGVWTYLLNRPPELQMIETPTESVFPTPEENINAGIPTLQEIEIPPLPRTVSEPPNTEYFQNSKENLKGDLAKNFLGFSLYYPENWKQNDAKGKFLDISKDAPSGTPIEQMLVSYYESKGTFKADTELFPALVEETNTTLKEIVPNYEVISEGEKTVNNGWRAYEVRFKGSGKTANGENITLWGRRLFIPTSRPGMKNGYVVTMLATSLSPDVANVDDVGVKGELAAILETFEPNQSF